MRYIKWIFPVLFVLLGIFFSRFIHGHSFLGLCCFAIAALLVCYFLVGILRQHHMVAGKLLILILNCFLCFGLLVFGITELIVLNASRGQPETDCPYIVVLGAKVKALIRRSKGTMPGASSSIAAGPFRYNTSTLRFYKNEQEIVLSSRENAIMKLFIDNVNRIFSKDLIYELIWGETIIDENAIMVYINRLRQKIEDDPSKPRYIQTVRGLGYRFVV